MSNKAKPARDAFTFSLGGISAVSSFFITPAVADDLINEVRDGRLRGSPEGQPGKAARTLEPSGDVSGCRDERIIAYRVPATA